MTKQKADLAKAHILIADNDPMISEVLKNTLRHMGFTTITLVRSGRAAIDVLMSKHVDILITEWEMKPLDGLSLVKSIRQTEEARLALLPVIMLTSRAEKIDVVEARDAGVTEFLVKPFTAKTLFNRLEHVIDFPRDFIVAEMYVGPDRRRGKPRLEKNAEQETPEDRRKMLPAISGQPDKINHVNETQRPYKIIPNHALKKRIGVIESLNKVITADVLEEAQAQIASFKDESLKWIAEDMEKLEQAIPQIISTNTEEHMEALDLAKEVLLSLKSRAGTFDFILASDVAFSFYKFLRNKFIIGNAQHITIVRKHLEVIKIILARKVTGPGGKMEQDLVEGLAMLVQKFQDASAA